MLEGKKSGRKALTLTSRRNITRLIRDPESEESSSYGIDLHSIADDIGRIYPMARAFVRIFFTHKTFTVHLRTVWD